MEKSDPEICAPRDRYALSVNGAMDGAPARGVPGQMQISQGPFAIALLLSIFTPGRRRLASSPGVAVVTK